jgi:hypothetical protein
MLFLSKSFMLFSPQPLHVVDTRLGDEHLKLYLSTKLLAYHGFMSLNRAYRAVLK